MIDRYKPFIASTKLPVRIVLAPHHPLADKKGKMPEWILYYEVKHNKRFNTWEELQEDLDKGHVN